LKNTVLEVNRRKKLGETTGDTLHRGADDRPSTIRIGRAGMRVKYDEDVACRKSQLQTSEDLGWASDDDDRGGIEVG
jgi:hypothetical protein